LVVLLAASGGAALVRFKLLKPDALRDISKLVFNAFLPALLVTKVAQAIDLNTLVDLWIFPVSALLFILTGFALGGIACLATGVPKGRRSAVIAASGLANSGFLPIPLIIAICAVFPAFADRPDASALGITFISAYIMLFSPVMWLFGYNLLSCEKSWKLDTKRIFTPPIIGMIIGLSIGLTPGLKSTFCLREGLCYPIFAALDILAAGTIPCALIVLGGRFAEKREATSEVRGRTVFSVVLVKQILLPLLALGYIITLRRFEIISSDPLIALVLLIEAAAPPATNLIVICSIHKNNENSMSRILFWSYVSATFTLTCFVAVGMSIFA
jgi:predicted permease